LVSKLSDFGISCLLLESSVTGSEAHFTTQPMGTPAYMDPEFFGTGELTPQSDTYSFGITILRLLTGRAPLRLTRVVQEAVNDNDLRSVLDHSAGEWPLVQAEQLARIGLQCSELSRQKRPDLELDVWRVVQSMKKEAPSPLSQSFRSIFNESSRAVATPSYFLCPISQVIQSENIRCKLRLPPRRLPRRRPGRPRTLAAAPTFLPLPCRAAAGAGRRLGRAARRDGGGGASSSAAVVWWRGWRRSDRARSCWSRVGLGRAAPAAAAAPTRA
jgi:serine/threonine protein kinase